MSDISVGTLSSSGTTTYITGTVSGLDTDTLVQNAVDENNEAADNIDITIEENVAIIEAYEEFYSLSVAVQDSLSSLKSVTSRASTETNSFDERTGSLSSTGVDATSLISVTIDSGAPTGEYEITVVQEAKAMAVESTVQNSSDEALGLEGVFSIGLSDMQADTITITSDMTLEDIEEYINEGSEDSGVAASILKVSETEYQLIFTGTETNQDIEVSTTSGSVLSVLGFTDGIDSFLEDQISQESQGSIILFNSTEITRDDNVYDDLIEGVSLNIEGEDEDTTVTLSVEYDSSTVKEKIEAFVESYNALREFIITNQTVESDGSVSDAAVLFSDMLVDNLSYNVSKVLASAYYEDSSIQTLADLGISFDEENYLVIDEETTLDDALLNNYEDVASFFGTSMSTSNDSLGIISNTSLTTELEFEISITVDEEGDMSSAIVNGNENVFTINGSRLVGKDGTAYEGLTLAYVGDEDTTITVSIAAGLADLIYNNIEPYTSASDGLIQDEISSLEGVNDDLEEEADDIRERGEEIREREVERYAEMEAELELANNLLTQIRAILGISDDD